MRFAFVVLMGLTSASCATTDNAATPRTSTLMKPWLRDAEGYAIACCLVKQKEPYLQQQGDGWASIILERGNVALERLRLIDDRVQQVVAKGRPLVVRDESSPSGEATLPVLYCAEVIDDSAVREAIDQPLPSH